MTQASAAVLHAVQIINDHLLDSTAVLFTGAGVNYGLQDDKGRPFPLGNELSKRICESLLGDKDAVLDLQDSADMARRKFTDLELNRFISNDFKDYRPGVALHAASRLPWNSIYTTNYDTLLEKAAELRRASIYPIYSMSTDLSHIPSGVIPYYKIHGCIDHANAPDGRLVITSEDFRASEENRRTLFNRLRRDLLSKAFLFVGYSLKDSNLRQILDEVRNALGSDHLPPSFALRRTFTQTELEYWKDKYNVQLIDADASEFLAMLADTHDAYIPGVAKKASVAILGDEGIYSFQTVGGSFQLLSPEACVGSSNPKRFFSGGKYSWTDARDKIAPRRDEYWSLMEHLFADISDPTSIASYYLVDGAAGTGKTALCRMLAYDIASDFEVQVLLHVPGAPLDPSVLGALIDINRPARLVVFAKDGASIISEIDTFMSEVKRLKWPVSLVVEERRNEWLSALSRGKHSQPLEIALGSVSGDEIEGILDALERHDCLGKLKGLDRRHQQEHFASVAFKDLLVALREITSDQGFDEIVRDEYNSIPSELARKAYLYVSAVGQANLPLRYEHLIRLTGVTHQDLSKTILEPTDQILIETESVGNGKVSSGYALRTRHPIIASVIFNSAAPDDEDKYSVLREIVDLLDPGYPEDRRLLEQFARQHEIVGMLSDPDKPRAIFEAIAKKLPGRAFVLQQRSVLERHLGSPERAVSYAQQALKIEPGNMSIKNTLGFALEHCARNTYDPLKRQGYLREARKAFNECKERDPTNAFNFLGIANVMRTEAEQLPAADRALAFAELLGFLEEASLETGNSEIIAKALAEEQKRAGDPKEALRVVSDALVKQEGDTHLRILHVRLLQSAGMLQDALQSGLIGLRHDPNSWRLNWVVAKILRKTGGQIPAIRGHYDAACRHKGRELDLLVEYGGYLFEIGSRSKADEIFNLAQKSSTDGGARRKYRAFWKTQGGSADAVFDGRVKHKAGAMLTVMAIPANFEVQALQTDAVLRVGDSCRFTVAFDAYGAKGRLLLR